MKVPSVARPMRSAGTEPLMLHNGPALQAVSAVVRSTDE